MVPKIEICLKYFLVENTLKQPLWYYAICTHPPTTNFGRDKDRSGTNQEYLKEVRSKISNSYHNICWDSQKTLYALSIYRLHLDNKYGFP